MFTRRGDTGETDTGLRERVSKGSALVNVEGTLDETIAFIGNALALTLWDDIRNDLRQMQDDLFTLGEHITTSGKGRKIVPERTVWLEERVKVYRSEIGKIRLFVVPDGSQQATSLHMARTVSRRLERYAVSVTRELQLEMPILTYLNRISSLLFMLAIVSNKRQGLEERIWSIHRES